MASGETWGSRESACGTKRRYNTGEDAAREARKLGTPHILIYLCEYCHYFHLGRNSGLPKRVGGRKRPSRKKH